MKRLLFVYSAGGHVAPEFTADLARAAAQGAGVCSETHTQDVTLARNKALTRALRRLQQEERFDVVLLVDTDQSWTDEDARALAEHVRRSGHATSGCYLMKDGRVAGYPSGDRWVTGLGFLAIPRRQFLELAARAGEPFEDAVETGILEFTSSGVHVVDGRRQWVGEDMALTARLGGVDMVPLAIVHAKTVLLKPRLDTLPPELRRALTPLLGDAGKSDTPA